MVSLSRFEKKRKPKKKIWPVGPHEVGSAREIVVERAERFLEAVEKHQDAERRRERWLKRLALLRKRKRKTAGISRR